MRPRARRRPRGSPGTRCSGRGCPARLCLISSSPPSSPCSSSAVTVSSMPGVQKPHCSAACRVKASSSRSNSGRSARPSIVVTLFPVGVGGEVAARADGEAVDQDGACAAHLHVARALGAGQPERVAEEVEQQLLRREVADDLAAVDATGELHRGLRRRARPAAARRPSTRRRTRRGTSPAGAAARSSGADRAQLPERGGDRLQPCRALERDRCQHRPGNVLADGEHPVVLHQDSAPARRAPRRPGRPASSSTIRSGSSNRPTPSANRMPSWVRSARSAVVAPSAVA